MTMLARRQLLLGLATAGAFAVTPRLSFAAPGGGAKRFVFIIQRGAADGIATVQPVGDPDYLRLREPLAAPGGVRLDGMFALHPALVETGKLYAARQALFVHAVGSPYRDRSHFDGQNVLETGGSAAYQLKDGWLNRLTGLLPRQEALALASTIPAGLRGSAPVTSYAPSRLPEASDDLLARVSQLYQPDAQLHGMWEQALAARLLAGEAGVGQDAAALGTLAAEFLTEPAGPRIAMIETGGWDTHAEQKQRLLRRLEGLDKLIGALRIGLGPAWGDTLVLVATEFGRTAAANGTGGTDHGTASAAMLLGGGVAGGRVVTDWPGLGAGQLLDGRDLRPTTPLPSLVSGAVAAHFALDPARVARTLFPSADARPLAGLLRVT